MALANETLEAIRTEIRLLIAQYLIAYPEDAALPVDVLRRMAAETVLEDRRAAAAAYDALSRAA